MALSGGTEYVHPSFPRVSLPSTTHPDLLQKCVVRMRPGPRDAVATKIRPPAAAGSKPPRRHISTTAMPAIVHGALVGIATACAVTRSVPVALTEAAVLLAGVTMIRR
jgi:hypothetical protein